jgi:hypothetical protein
MGQKLFKLEMMITEAEWLQVQRALRSCESNAQLLAGKMPAHKHRFLSRATGYSSLIDKIRLSLVYQMDIHKLVDLSPCVPNPIVRARHIVYSTRKLKSRGKEDNQHVYDTSKTKEDNSTSRPPCDRIPPSKAVANSSFR